MFTNRPAHREQLRSDRRVALVTGGGCGFRHKFGATRSGSMASMTVTRLRRAGTIARIARGHGRRGRGRRTHDPGPIAVPADRLASYRLIADVFDLRGNAPRQAATAAGSPSGADVAR